MNSESGSSEFRVAAFLAGILVLLATVAALNTSAGAQVVLKQLSTDTFANTDSQHATEVEPDTYSLGSALVTAFQVGRRYANRRGSDIGFATTTNGGATWTKRFLPGVTQYYKSGHYQAASDALVVYDARHGFWLIASLGISDTNGNTVLFVSRSANGKTWNNPRTTGIATSSGRTPESGTRF